MNNVLLIDAEPLAVTGRNVVRDDEGSISVREVHRVHGDGLVDVIGAARRGVRFLSRKVRAAALTGGETPVVLLAIEGRAGGVADDGAVLPLGGIVPRAASRAEAAVRDAIVDGVGESERDREVLHGGNCEGAIIVRARLSGDGYRHDDLEGSNRFHEMRS